MDILIMLLLFAILLLVWRGANRGLVIALCAIALVAIVALFRYHVTSHLDLSF